MYYVGADPGYSGGIAAVCGEDAFVFTIPNRLSIKVAVNRFIEMDVDSIAAVESVHSFPGQGVASSFTFGMAYGALLQGLEMKGFIVLPVTPRTWQGTLDLPTLKEAGSKTAKKNAHKELAASLFPSVRVTHAVADALLIAHWLETYSAK